VNNLTRFRDHLVRDFFNEWMSPGVVIRPLHGRSLPEDFAVDIREKDSNYVLDAEIPGLKKEDITVEVDGRRVTISAEIKQCDQKAEGERVVQSERYYGSISRSFVLASELDSSGCQASYQNGVLSLTIPKKSVASVKKISIQ